MHGRRPDDAGTGRRNCTEAMGRPAGRPGQGCGVQQRESGACRQAQPVALHGHEDERPESGALNRGEPSADRDDRWADPAVLARQARVPHRHRLRHAPRRLPRCSRAGLRGRARRRGAQATHRDPADGGAGPPREDAATAVAGYQSLCDAGCLAVMGPYITDNAMALLPGNGTAAVCRLFRRTVPRRSTASTASPLAMVASPKKERSSPAGCARSGFQRVAAVTEVSPGGDEYSKAFRAAAKTQSGESRC